MTYHKGGGWWEEDDYDDDDDDFARLRVLEILMRGGRGKPRDFALTCD